MESREGGDARKMKKESKIKIKERRRSLFYTTFRRGECWRKSKPRREKEQPKKKKKERAPERGLFPLLFSSSAGLPFPLTGIQSPYFGQSIKPFKPSISEYLAILFFYSS